MMERKEIIIELENKLLFVKIIIILNKRKNYNNIKYLIFIYIISLLNKIIYTDFVNTFFFISLCIIIKGTTKCSLSNLLLLKYNIIIFNL